MPEYYCYKCARNKGHIAPIDPSAINATPYQLEKYLKHTAPTGIYPKNSVFNDPSWQSYKDYMVAPAASGCLEIDDAGRKNLIYFAGEETGLLYENGTFTASCSGVMLVCGEDVGKAHSFPTDFFSESRICKGCGELVPFDPRK